MSTESLKIVTPLAISDAMLIATDVPEADYSAWSAAVEYALGARVIDAAAHKIYESLQAGNLGNATSDPLWWIEASPTNRWKLFDTSNSTQTAQANSMSYTLRSPNAMPALAALNLSNATSIRVRVSHPTYGDLYDQTADLTPQPAAADWWSWFFGARRAPSQHIITNLPAIPGGDITVDLTGGAGLAVGVLMLGQIINLGVGVKYGVKVGIQDYSRKETNDFGDTVLVRRAYAKRASFDLILTADEVDAMQAALADLRATPCLWIGSGRYESTVVFGIYKQFDILISYPNFSDCQLELEGLT